MNKKKSFRDLLVPTQEVPTAPTPTKGLKTQLKADKPLSTSIEDAFVTAGGLEELALTPNLDLLRSRAASKLNTPEVSLSDTDQAEKKAAKAQKKQDKQEKKRAKLLNQYGGEPATVSFQWPADLRDKLQTTLETQGGSADLIFLKAAIKYIQKAEKKK